MIRIKKIAMLFGCVAWLAAGTLFAATLEIETSSVVLVAGHTVEVPLSSSMPIASDLTAKGLFNPDDVTFTAGPRCHLSAHGCTLLITAAPTSKNYTAVPVMVYESNATNRPVFALSVIQPGETAPINVELSKDDSALRMLSSQIDSEKNAAINNTTQHFVSTINSKQVPLQRSGNALFYGVAEPHPGGLLVKAKTTINNFRDTTNGPAYQIVTLTNQDIKQPLSVAITGSGANSFSIDNNASDYGVNKNCAAITNINSGDSCLVIIKGKIGNPNQTPQRAVLTIHGNNNNIAKFALTNTTYVYAAGGFNTLGNASVSGGALLAECTAGTCSNALQGTTGNNYASTNFSVGQWINTLAITPAGNLIVGGVFGAIGGATSGASSGTAALLAQCTPGSVIGNSCINQIGTGIANPYAFNNAYIDAVTAPFLIASSNFMAVAGEFTNIRNFSVTAGGRMLAKCGYSGTSSNQTCNNYLSLSRYANNAISALDYFNSTVNVGGLFTQIAGYPSSAPSSGTTFASCTTSTCSNGMGSNNPNSSVLGMTDDGISLYMGGVFTQIGGYTDSNGGYPLVSCTVATTTTCSNALAGTNDANGYIEGLTYSGGNLYVGGKFTTIGGAMPVSGGNMLAVCSVGGSCTNFITDPNPYASGGDWGGNISAVAVGTQTSIAAF